MNRPASDLREGDRVVFSIGPRFGVIRRLYDSPAGKPGFYALIAADDGCLDARPVADLALAKPANAQTKGNA